LRRAGGICGVEQAHCISGSVIRALNETGSPPASIKRRASMYVAYAQRELSVAQRRIGQITAAHITPARADRSSENS
jgi:hypothetical protein